MEANPEIAYGMHTSAPSLEADHAVGQDTHISAPSVDADSVRIKVLGIGEELF